MQLRSGITIFASDMGQAKAFYETSLGMTLTHDEDGFWARRDGVELRVEGGAKPRERGRAVHEHAAGRRHIRRQIGEASVRESV